MNTMNNGRKPTFFFNTMPTRYHQSWRDKFDSARTKEELDNIKNLCCKNCRFTCGLKLCRFENDYILYREMIDDIRRPKVVYVDKPKPEVFVRSREYKISPQHQCVKSCKTQITKMLKHNLTDEVKDVLAQVSSHIDGARFKRAYNLCVKHNIIKIAETIEKFLATKEVK